MCISPNDCQGRQHTTFANTRSWRDHVDDRAILRIYRCASVLPGRKYCMTAVGTVILQDVPPYIMAAGNTASPPWAEQRRSPNAGFFTRAEAEAVLYRILYKRTDV